VIKLASRCAAVVVAGSALTLAVGLLPAQAATTGWRIETTVAVRGSETLFAGVAASSPADAWATGFSAKDKGTSSPKPLIRHWTGKAWRSVTLPAKVARAWANVAPVDALVGAASARSVWVFGSFTGSYLRLSGSRWSLGQLPGVSEKSGALVLIDAVKVINGTNVWAFGERDSVSGSQEVSAPYAAYYNGHKWAKVTVPGTGAITAVAAVSSSDIWAVESAESSSVLSSAAANSGRRSPGCGPAGRAAVDSQCRLA
jgi:hypothetical protein